MLLPIQIKGFGEKVVCNSLHISQFYVLYNLQNLASSIVHSLGISPPRHLYFVTVLKGHSAKKGTL